MANQPKKYQKFVATAATATLVASAIVPVASAAEKKFTDIEKYAQETQDAIYSLVDRGVITGKSDSIFAPAELITRGQVVKMMGRYLVNDGVAEVPTDWASKQRFTDLPVDFKDQDLVKNAAVVFDNGVFQGSNGKLNVSNNISRENMALVLDRAIGALNGKTLVELAKEEGLKGNVKDINSAKAEARDAIQALNAFGISEVDNFKPKNNVTRAQFALFLERTIDAVLSDTTEQLVEKAVVAGNALPKPEDVTKDNAADAQEKVDFAQRSLEKAQKALNEDKDLSADEKNALQAKLDKVKEQIEAVKKAIANTELTEGITSVKAINDTRVEVTFGKAIDKDIAREIEKEPKRFVVYNGGQNAHTAGVIKADYVSFNSDYTKATLTLDGTPDVDVKYTVALMDSEDNVAAEVVHKSTPTILKESAGQPSLTVNSDQDKFVLDFKTKMKDSAKEIGNYKIYDDRGNSIPGISEDKLSEVVKNGSNADWVDATTKKAVEFELEPGKLDAGKTYRVVVEKEVKTDDGDILSDSQRRINVKTPSVSEARPKAKIARVTGQNNKEITLVFDKKLAEQEVNKKLVEVKTPTGKSIQVEKVEAKNDSKNLVITLAEELDKDITYSVDVPANAVANYIFQNATNEKVSAMKAKAQENISVASMSAKFERDVKDKEKADLLLTFDQAVKENLNLAKLKIEESGKEPTELTGLEVELDTNDVTGKTLRVKNITEKIKIESDKNYKVVLEKGGVETDSAEGIENQKELSTTISGLDVTAPVIDNVEFASAEKIVVEFDKNISSNIKAGDVYVQGFRLEKAGEFRTAELNGDTDLKVSVSGTKLTITPADSNTKFVTGYTSELNNTNFFSIKAEKIKGSNDVVQKNKMEVAFTDEKTVKLTVDGDDKNNNDNLDFIDNAKPVLIGAKTGVNAIELTYSEAVVSKGTGEENIGNQFSVKNAEIKNYGNIAAELEDNNNKVVLGFANVDGEPVIKAKDYPNLEITYRAHTSYELKDAKGNKVAGTTLKGAKNGTITGAPTPTEPEKTADEQKKLAEEKTKAANDASTASKKALEEGKIAEAVAKAAEAVKAAQEAKTAAEKSDSLSAVNAAKKAETAAKEAETAAKEAETAAKELADAKTALQEEFAKAEKVETAEVSTDGKDVETTKKWTTQAELDTFNQAKEDAKVVVEKENATKAELTQAKTALQTAIQTYEDAKKAGTKA